MIKHKIIQTTLFTGLVIIFSILTPVSANLSQALDFDADKSSSPDTEYNSTEKFNKNYRRWRRRGRVWKNKYRRNRRDPYYYYIYRRNRRQRINEDDYRYWNHRDRGDRYYYYRYKNDRNRRNWDDDFNRF